jgi:hypothetical protein
MVPRRSITGGASIIIRSGRIAEAVALLPQEKTL